MSFISWQAVLFLQKGASPSLAPPSSAGSIGIWERAKAIWGVSGFQGGGPTPSYPPQPQYFDRDCSPSLEQDVGATKATLPCSPGCGVITTRYSSITFKEPM